MRVVLICPSNMMYMPYVGNYTNILDKLGVNYDTINWDRFKIEEEGEFVYKDAKIGHQRNLVDYYKYSRFILNCFKKKKYDKVVVFGIQNLIFLKRFLIKEYNNKFIIDIRDYNKAIKFFSLQKLIDCSAFTVLSSHGYQEWLPKRKKYVINHNTQINSTDELSKVDVKLKNTEALNISYIGSIRDCDINIKFIDSMKNAEKMKLNFYGEGTANKEIESYLIDNKIRNVRLKGKYKIEQERELYLDSDIINILIPNDDINSRTLLPNRLYNAVIAGKPIIAYEGTYVSEVIKKHNLGLIINSFNNIEKTVTTYLDNFSNDIYEKGRRMFFNRIIEENIEFWNRVEEFLN